MSFDLTRYVNKYLLVCTNTRNDNTIIDSTNKALKFYCNWFYVSIFQIKKFFVKSMGRIFVDILSNIDNDNVETTLIDSWLQDVLDIYTVKKFY